MKFLLVLGILLSGHLALAQRSIGDIKVTVESDGESLESCFKAIERQTGLLFAFLPSQVDPYTNINLPPATRTISATLDLVLSGTNLTYRQMNNSIVIFEKPNDQFQDSTVANHVELPPLISGRVTSPEGRALSDVNIIIKGSSVGTKTNDGWYSIYAEGDAVLVFSHVSFKTVEVAVKKRMTIDVVLEHEESVLNEVEINAGYWQVKETEQTGNISRLTRKDFETLTISNPLQLLQGRMPGVYVQQTSGVPGGNISVQIRGINCLRPEGNYPLYLIDGIPYPAVSVSSPFVSNDIIEEGSPLSHLATADIESIEVLKDADATAIYGSRGANGVVLITLKKGMKGKNKVGLHVAQGAGHVTRTMKLLNAKQWIEMRKEAFANDGATMTNNNARDLLIWDTTRYTDWQKDLIGGYASITDLRASVSGGDESKQYFFSSSYYRETPPFPGSFVFQKGSWYFNFNMEPQKRFMFNFTAGYVMTENDLPREDPTRASRELAPNAPAAYDDKGDFNWDDNGWINPMSRLLQTYNGTTSNSLAKGLLKYSIASALELKSSLGFIKLETTEWQKIPMASFNPKLADENRSIHGDNSITTWIAEPQLQYKQKGPKQELQVLVGLTFQQTVTKGKTLSGIGYKYDALLENLMSAREMILLEDNQVKYRYNSVLSRLNYAYKKKLFLNLTGRRDGSSRLSPGKRFGNFGAIGASWIFTKERFMGNDLSWLSFGKLRASYGITGSDQVGDYQYMATYSSTINSYNGLTGTIPTRLGNSYYSWETNKKSEVALDVGMLNNRVMLSLSYYHNLSSNQIADLSLPVITGQSSIKANIPAVVKNTGLEVVLNAIVITKQRFSWSSSFNISVPRNKLVRYPNLASSSYGNQYVIGGDLLIQSRYHFTGLDAGTGIYTIQDVNGDGSISSPSDLQPIKKIGQNMFGGMQSTVQFGNLSLDVFVQVVRQTAYNYLTLFSNIAPGSRFSNQPGFVMDRWQRPGDDTDIQRFTTLSLSKAAISYRNMASSDHAISDASFARVKDITLSWRHFGTSPNLTIYIQGHNLFTVTRYQGYDPESMASGALPPLRTLMCGIKMAL